jgi:hypothetical protein
VYYEFFLGYHDLAGHLGQDTTCRNIRRDYFWRGMTKQILDYTARCRNCQKVGKGLKRNIPKLKPIKPPHSAWSQIGIDLQGPFPVTERGNRYILVAKCYLTKFFVARPITDKKENTVATEIYKIYCEYGFVNAILNDQGLEFTNKV